MSRRRRSSCPTAALSAASGADGRAPYINEGGLDRGGKHCDKEGKDGVLIGPGRGLVCSQTRQPQDFVAIVFVLSKIDRGMIRCMTTWGHCHLCHPVSLRMSSTAKNLPALSLLPTLLSLTMPSAPASSTSLLTSTGVGGLQ